MRLIDADALKKALHNFFDGKVIDEPTYILRDVFCYIDNAPTVEYPFYQEAYQTGYEEGKNERPQCEFTRNELKSWLYRIASNNLDNELGRSCEEIICRLNGFERFVSDMRRGKE